MSKDLIGIAGGLNLYEFCGSNPVNFVDPMGLCEKPWYKKEIPENPPLPQETQDFLDVMGGISDILPSPKYVPPGVGPGGFGVPGSGIINFGKRAAETQQEQHQTEWQFGTPDVGGQLTR